MEREIGAVDMAIPAQYIALWMEKEEHGSLFPNLSTTYGARGAGEILFLTEPIIRHKNEVSKNDK